MILELLTGFIPLASGLYGAIIVLPVVFYILPFAALFLFLSTSPMSSQAQTQLAQSESTKPALTQSWINRNESKNIWFVEKNSPSTTIRQKTSLPFTAPPGPPIIFGPPVFSFLLTKSKDNLISPAVLKMMASRAPPGEAIS